MSNVLVIAPHPDDESLGAGGALLKHKAAGDRIACVFVTEIRESIGFTCVEISQRRQELEKIERFYDFDRVDYLRFPTTQLTPSDTNALISSFSKIVREFLPDMVYLPFRDDIHSDHRVIFEAAYSCTKAFRYSSVKQVLMYETLSETNYSHRDFRPNVYVDISPYMDLKIEALRIFGSQMAPPPFPRSYENVKALARVRGAAASVEFAEAFELIKEIR